MNQTKQAAYHSPRMAQDIKNWAKVPKKSKVAWMVKDRYSLLDVVLVLGAIKLLIWFVGHVHVSINWS